MKVKKYASADIGINSEIWNTAETQYIDSCTWEDYAYKPKTSFRIIWADDGICVKYETDETPVVVKHFEKNSMVCKDSCVEFFINARPESDAGYINFEINAKGVMHAAIGNGRENRTFFGNDVNFTIFKIETEETKNGWKCKFFVPLYFLEAVYGGISSNMKGNAYKCGDETGHTHYCTLFPVKTKEPDFHRPEYFGDIILENFNK